jgi:hypothetical protein
MSVVAVQRDLSSESIFGCRMERGIDDGDIILPRHDGVAHGEI